MESQNPKEKEANQLVLDQKPKNKDHHHHHHHHHLHHLHHQNSPPSPLSSPSHEFSFTITLHPSPTSTPTSFKHSKNSSPRYSSSSSSSFALDLAPADDIFFHGHLLPLHLLSSLPLPSSTSPRPSTDTICIENCALPSRSESINYHEKDHLRDKKKPNSLSSFFGIRKWWGKWSDDQNSNSNNNKSSSSTYKKKKAFDVRYYWRKYASLVELLFSSKGEKGKRDLHRRPYSFSGNANPKERDRWMRRRGEFSAPASMRTSPTNSGLLLAKPAGLSTSNESSMEELQNAIQAAIAHCKNSTGKKEDLCKC